MMFMFRFPRIFSRMARRPRTPVNTLKPDEIWNVIFLLQDQLNAQYRYTTLVQKVTRDLQMIESQCANTARWLKTLEAERNPVFLGTAAVGLFRKGRVLASNVSSYATLIKDTVPELKAIVTADIVNAREVTSAAALALAERGVVVGPDTEATASSINVSTLSRRQRRKLAARLARIADEVAITSRYLCEDFTAAQAVDLGMVVVVLGQMQELAKWLADQEQATIGKQKKRSRR